MIDSSDSDSDFHKLVQRRPDNIEMSSDSDLSPVKHQPRRKEPTHAVQSKHEEVKSRDKSFESLADFNRRMKPAEPKSTEKAVEKATIKTKYV